MNSYLDNVHRQIALGRRIDAFWDKWSQRCVGLWRRGVRDPDLAETICSRVRSRLAKIEMGEAVPFRRARLNHGEVRLGRDLAVPRQVAADIWLPKDYFSTHLVTVGTTGSAKSTLAAHLSMELAKARAATWQISCYKADLRGQLPRFRSEGLDLTVVRAGDLKYNPLNRGLNEPRAHLMAVTARLERWLAVPPRADLLLRAVCHELFAEFGIFSGQRDRSPTLFHVYERLRTSKGLNVPARDALLDRLGSFLERYSPRCGAWLKGWNPTDLVRNIVFELKGAGEDVKGFLLESFLDHVFQQEIERGVVNGPLDLFIFLDDAQRLVNANGSTVMTGLDEKVGLIRGCGKGIGILVQTLHGISPHLLLNLNIRLLGRTVEHEAWMTMGRNLNMTDQQIEWAKLNLRRGCFVGAVAEGDWHEPFVFEAPYVELASNVTDADVIESQRPLDSLPVIPADEFRNWERHPVAELAGASAESSASSAPSATGLDLAEAEWRYLEAVVDGSGQTATQYARAAHLNGQRAAEVRARLVAAGLVREEEVATSPRGRTAIVIRPLEAGLAAVARRRAGGGS